MYKIIISFLTIISVAQAGTTLLEKTLLKSQAIKSTLDKVEVLSNKSATTPAERAQYIKDLYYSVNGYPSGYDTSMSPAPHLDQFNLVLGQQGIGGILYAAAYETCESIPVSGSLTGISEAAGSLTLNFGAATKTVPSYYTTDAGTTMDKRIDISGSVAIEIELKCNADTSIQTGYIKFTYTQYNIVYEGYFQQNSTTKAVNVDMYIKTQTGAGNDLLIPTQFSTADGTNFTMFSAYIGLSGGGAITDNLVAVNGQADGIAQIAYLNTSDTSGSPVTTSPDNFGSLSTSGGTTVAVECIDITAETTTTGCTSVPAPGSLTIGGTTSTWTVTSLKSVSL